MSYQQSEREKLLKKIIQQNSTSLHDKIPEQKL
jgi:hypothetical protein